jgi:hypothetical protein
MQQHAAVAARVCTAMQCGPGHCAYLVGFARVMREGLLAGYDAAQHDPVLRAGFYHTSCVLAHQFYQYEALLATRTAQHGG